MNSIGQTEVASTPPAMQPAVIAVKGLFDFLDILRGRLWEKIYSFDSQYFAAENICLISLTCVDKTKVLKISPSNVKSYPVRK